MSTRTTMAIAPWLASLVLCPLARTQADEPRPPAFTIGPLDQIVTDVATDGTVWARGSNWKMRVGSANASFFPQLGDAAPRHLPLDFGAPQVSVAGQPIALGAGQASLAGQRARIDRGVIDEVYDFSVSHVEQSFVIEALPVRGEIVVRIPVATELTFEGRDQGLRFVAPGFGPVRYGDATILDAANRRIGALSQFDGNAIEIRVPAEFVAGAQLPIVVDPLITPAFDIQTTGALGAPDVAYDAENDVWLVVYHEGSSGSDHDILCRRFDGDGTLLDTVASDVSSDDSTDPAVANANASNQFLVVWRKEKNGLFDEIEIKGRTRNANGSTQSSPFTVSNGSDNESDPDVGGSNSTFYFVVWQENPAIGADGENVSGARVTTGGSVTSVVDIATTLSDETHPSVCKQADQNWMVVWERETNGHGDIHAAIIDLNGAMSTPDLALETSSLNDSDPRCVANVPNGNFLVSWERAFTSSGLDVDLVGGLYSRVGSSIILDSNFVNYSDLEQPNETVNDNANAAWARNGNRFVLIQQRSSINNTKVASLNFDGADPIYLEEGLQLPGGSIASYEIASRSESFGAPGRSLIVQRSTPSASIPHKLVGTFFDTTTAGGVTVVQTGCGGAAEPKLTSGSTALLCEEFSLKAGGFVQALLFVGTPANIPLCPGQSGCALGATPTLILPFANGTANFTLPCDPALLDFPVAITGVSLLGSGSAAGMCGPPKHSQKFLTSDTLVIDFQ